MRGDLCAHCSRAEDRYAANHHLWHSTGWWLVVSGWYAGRVNTAFEILAALSFCHLLNDMMQSLIPAIYPILKQSFHLDFAQVGLITFVLQLSGALLQPIIGFYS